MPYKPIERINELLTMLRERDMEWLERQIRSTLALGRPTENTETPITHIDRRPSPTRRPPTQYRPYSRDEQIEVTMDTLQAMIIAPPRMLEEAEKIATEIQPPTNEGVHISIQLMTPGNESSELFYQPGSFDDVRRLEELMPPLKEWLNVSAE